MKIAITPEEYFKINSELASLQKSLEQLKFQRENRYGMVTEANNLINMEYLAERLCNILDLTFKNKEFIKEETE